MPTRSIHSSAAARRPVGRRALVCALCAGLLGLGLLARPAAWAAPALDFVVIVHADNPINVSTRAELSAMFLKRSVRWPDGEAVRPADLLPDANARKEFSEEILQRSVVAVRRYWQQRIFSGRELPPPELDSEQSVIQFVESTRGAIGYVSAHAKLKSAKVVSIRGD